jgi:hypothetical protein
MKNIYKIILIFNFQFSIFNFQSFSQTAPGIEWQNTIGANYQDVLYSINKTYDGGYIIGGRSSSGSSGDKSENNIGGADYWVVKIDSSGIIQWENTIGGSGWDELKSIQQTLDSGYILGGFSNSPISGDKTEGTMDGDCWVVKLGKTGNIQWQNTIGGSDLDYLAIIEQTTDKGYILGAESQSDSSGDKTENSVGPYAYKTDYWVIKLDSAGDIEWQNTIGGDDNESMRDIHQTADGGYIFGGYSESGATGDKTEYNQGHSDYWIVKIDSMGNIQWQNTIG